MGNLGYIVNIFNQFPSLHLPTFFGQTSHAYLIDEPCDLCKEMASRPILNEKFG